MLHTPRGIQGMARKKPTKSKFTKQELKAATARIKRSGLGEILTNSPSQRERNLAKQIALGNSDSVVISKAMAKRYKETSGHGIEIIERPGKNPIAIGAKRLGYTKTRISKGEPIFEGMYARVRPLKGGEIETIVLPINSTSIPEFIEALKDNPEWNGLKTQNDRFTVRFHVDGATYGLNDPQQFGTMSQLAQFMQHYKSAHKAEGQSKRNQRKYLEMLEIVRVRKDRHDLRNEEQLERVAMKKKLAAYKRKRKQRGG